MNATKLWAGLAVFFAVVAILGVCVSGYMEIKRRQEIAKNLEEIIGIIEDSYYDEHPEYTRPQ